MTLLLIAMIISISSINHSKIGLQNPINNFVMYFSHFAAIHQVLPSLENSASR
jgi:hypothetical protein